MKLDGPALYAMLLSAANALDNNKVAINNMNVFPVPDGDTGINMALTLNAVKNLDEDPSQQKVSELSKKIASLILRAARGNSGAIISLFFRGMSKAFCDSDEIDTTDVARAFRKGTDEAYRAVMNPTEGTILTVMRRCAEEAERAVAENKFATDDVRGLFSYIVDVGEEALAHTPDQLPILKEVNVVDAGGLGFMTALNGMLASLNNKPVQQLAADNEPSEADFTSFDTEDITFPYCTECIVEKFDEYKGEGNADEFHAFLGGIGDSLVFIEDEAIIKVHVHTDHPGLVLENAGKYGMFATVKIENMRKQHSAIVSDKNESKPKNEIAAPEKTFGFVSVCMGNGIKDTFIDIGADNIIFGGQTMNPSTQDIIDGVNKTPAEIVYVLPNNKNIYLVAKQAAKLIKDKKVIVLETRSVPQGICAMLAFDPEADEATNTSAMTEAVTGVTSMSITHAVRDTTIGGEKIEDGQMLGMVDGAIDCVADTCESCIEKLTEKMSGACYITVFYGEEVIEEQAEKVLDIIKNAVPDAEIVAISGGQPIYSYIISVEK
ncbi:MAG: DAK2 domain-containing protein [Ruminococcaceae bacterium]|nr:DAK2 domain-containing protein [Oscillospiraceae bacterium]